MLAVLAFAAPAAATPDEDLASARTAFFAGVQAQEQGRFRAALERYAEVRRVIVSPPLLFNIATCQEHLNELVEAVATYGSALSLAREKGEKEVVEAASARIAALEKEVPRLFVRLAPGTQGAEVIFDDVPVDVRSPDGIRTNPGIHRLIIRSDAHVQMSAQMLRLERQEVREIEVDLGERRSEALARSAAEAPQPHGGDKGPAPAVAPMPAPERRTYVPALVAGGATVALAGAALVTGLVGHSKRDRFEELNAQATAANHGERAELRSDGIAFYTANAVLVVGTVIAAGVTTYFFLRPPSARQSTAQTSFTSVLASIPLGMSF